ncbi:MAG: hypothetical protein QXL15_02355 [Candidatus Korarchaeota archaeon]
MFLVDEIPAWDEGLVRCTVKIEFDTPPPFWIGSALRSLIGKYLRPKDCITCPSCDSEIKNECVYYHLFEEKKEGGGIKPLFVSIPLPPTMFEGIMPAEVAGWSEKGRILEFGVTTVRKSFLIRWLTALIAAGMNGIKRHEFKLIEVRDHKGLLVCDGKRLNVPTQFDILHDVAKVDFTDFLYVQYTPHHKYLPLPLKEVVRDIWRRLLLLTNEHGNKCRIPEPKVSGQLETYVVKCLSLPRKSKRSEKRVFHGSVGIMRYTNVELDDTARWLLGLADVIGGGKNASFGFGFAKILRPSDVPSYIDKI